MSKDVQLTDEERRILADIERYEHELRPTVAWRRLSSREGLWGKVWPWVTVAIGTAVLTTGLLANLGLVPFAGFVILLMGVTRATARMSLVGWRARLQAARRNLSSPRSGRDET